jgi:NDP-sugar pyrophosphorylase family protein
MQVVVLIGGLGTRLYPLTYTVPKCLLPIGNKRFLSILLDWLKRNGVTDVVFAVSHFAPTIAEFIKSDLADCGIPITLRHETDPLGSAGALVNCADLLHDDFILLNGDVLMDLNLEELSGFHRKNSAAVTTTVSEVDDPSHYGILDVQEDGRTLDWQEKPTREDAKSKWGNVGAWAMTKRVLDFIPAGRFTSLEKETFPQILAEGLLFYAYKFEGYWKDIGTVDKYVQANRDLLNGVISGLQPAGKEIQPGIWVESPECVPDDIQVTSPVVIGKDCRIGSGVKLAGPVVIGSDVQIGDGVEMASTVVWNGASVGSGTKMSSSVLGGATIGEECVLNPGCVVATNSAVAARSVLASNTSLGPGSRLP